MKRKAFLTLILMFLFGFFLIASPQRVTIGAGNDFFSYGFSRNDDDQLSFSERFGFSSDRWGVEIDIDSITNRGWKDGWVLSDEKIGSDSTDWYSGRYDSLKIFGNYKFQFSLTDVISLKMDPQIGISLVGNLGMDFFQNWMHSVRKIHDVNIPYDENGIKVKTFFGGNFEFSYDFFKFENNILTISAQAQVAVTQKFRGEEYFGLELSLSNPNFVPVSLNLGYSINQSFSSSKTEKLFSSNLNGFRFGFEIDTGFILMNYMSPVESSFGFGVVSLEVMSFLRPANWNETDMILRFGTKACIDDFYTVFALETLLNDKWSVVFEDSNIASQPVSHEEELASDFSRVPRAKKNNSIFTIGAKRYFYIKEAQDWVVPYVSSSVGFARWNLVELYNSISTSYYSEKDRWDYMSGIADFIVGAKLLSEGTLVSDITTFSIDLFGGVMHIPGLQKGFPTDNTLSVSPVLGICIDAGIDV